MPKKYVVMITGYDRCGKDYIAQKLKEDLNADVIHLADSLKNICWDILDIDRETLEACKNKNGLIEIETSIPCFSNKVFPSAYNARNFIIKVATSIRKHLGKNVFIDALKENIFNSKKDIIIVPDVRFEIEYYSIKNMNNTNTVLIKIDSDLEECGKNGIKYEVDNLNPDILFKNTKNERSFNINYDWLLKEIKNRLGFKKKILYKIFNNDRYYLITEENNKEHYYEMTIGEEAYFYVTGKIKENVKEIDNFKDFSLLVLFGTLNAVEIMNKIEHFEFKEGKYIFLITENYNCIFNKETANYYMYNNRLTLIKNKKQIEINLTNKTIITRGNIVLVLSNKYIKETDDED